VLSRQPTQRQLDFLDWEFGIFLHFGIRTFYEGWKDWDERPMEASRFDPSELDCDQWARVAKEAGAGYMVMTSKHHDGFANWPSAYSEFGVKRAPWKDGQGDVVKEYVEACRHHGLKVGLYYSPAEKDQRRFEDASEYDTYFINQIREILEPYGTIDILWFDGAGSENHTYDWPRIVAAVREMQPEVMIFEMADPSMRWIGNESGIAPFGHSNLTSEMPESIVSEREAAPWFLPGECDCMIRDDYWFYQDHDRETVKSVDELVGLYCNSVGQGANLLVNIGPDRRGLLPEPDVSAILGMRKELNRRFSQPVTTWEQVKQADDQAWSYEASDHFLFDHVILQEDLSHGEFVTEFEIEIQTGVHGIRVCVYRGSTIGHKQIVQLPTTRARTVTVRVTSEQGRGALRSMEVHYVAGLDRE